MRRPPFQLTPPVLSFAPRLWLLAGWLSVALGSTGCDSGGGSLGRLNIELAGLSDSICDSNFADQRAPCTTVRVYRRGADGTLSTIRLKRPDDEGTAVMLRFDSPSLLFDADFGAVTERVGDLELRVYGDDGAPLAGASIEDVDFASGQEIRVRLYPYESWACPGGSDDGDLVPRAFHQAVRLDDGNVLIFGGVAGSPDINAASVIDPTRPGAVLQRQVELYDATAHRFRRVAATDVDGQDGFGRVLFDAYYLGSTEAGGGREHRIRVIGGLTIPADDAGAVVLRFDSRGTLGGPLGSPVAATTRDGVGRAEVGGAVDVIYNTASGQITVEEAEPVTVVPRGALVSVSPFLGETGSDFGVVLIGLAPLGGAWQPADTFYTTRRDGVAVEPARTLLHPRLGGTATPIPMFDAYLVWGGNAGAPLGVGPFAGEIHDRGGTVANPISSDALPLPSPTAFHSATPLSADLVLIAGGHLVGADGAVSFTPPSQPLTVLEVESLSRVVARPISAPGWTSTMFHTATPVDGLGVLLVGGALVDSSENRLVPSAQVGVVESFRFSALTPLNRARFGHTTTPLSGRRVLVVGGLEPADGSTDLTALRTPELLFHDPAPRSLMGGECSTDQTEDLDGGVTGVDAALPPRLDGGAPATDAGTDAGPSDGSIDSGADAGFDAGP